MYEVDTIITLWDNGAGWNIYNRTVISHLLEFINYRTRIVVQLDRPSRENQNYFNNLLKQGVIHKLTIPKPIEGHSPKDLNKIFLQAFKHIENPWVVHFDGDMFFYRNGYVDWLPHFIQRIESRYKNTGAIIHTMPYNHYNPLMGKLEPRYQAVKWVSTRFFVTEAQTVLEAIDFFQQREELEYPFEGIMYQKRLSRLGLNSYGIPFNPDFLILHISNMHDWTESLWNEYTTALRNRNEILLKNISHSDWGDLYGGGYDIYEKEIWGKGTWGTSGNEGGIIDLFGGSQ